MKNLKVLNELIEKMSANQETADKVKKAFLEMAERRNIREDIEDKLISYHYGKVWLCDIKRFNSLENLKLHFDRTTTLEEIPDAQIEVAIEIFSIFFPEITQWLNPTVEGVRNAAEELTIFFLLLIFVYIIEGTLWDEKPLYLGQFSDEAQGRGLLPVSYTHSYIPEDSGMNEGSLSFINAKGKHISLSWTLSGKTGARYLYNVEEVSLNVVDLLK